MFNHAPNDYVCPICLGVNGVENEQTLIRPSDIVYKDESVMAFVASYFITGNEGHVIVVPNLHYENFYDLPDHLGAQIVGIARKMAIAMRQTYRCDGITIVQNNEPAGNQHAFHYHLHIFPRYINDQLHLQMSNKVTTNADIRLRYVTLIKEALQNQMPH